MTFPAEGLKARWRTPVKRGYAGPAVAEGRVFVTDYEPTQGMRGTERALALDEATGEVLWVQEWDADYAGIQWEVGPGATPTVDDDRVYVLGRDGVLSALKTDTGELLWRKSFGEDYGVDRMMWGFDWGFASAPLVDGERLICLRRRLARRTGRGVRQDDRGGDLAVAAERGGPGGRPADHHRGRRRAAAHRLEPRRRSRRSIR